MKTIGDRLYVAALLPYDRQMKIDELAYRQFLQHFLKNEKFVRMGGGLCINPEAGEIFYLTRAEKRRALEIAMEEINGKIPVIAGTWALTTEETVETAKDCKAIGVAAFLSRRRAVRRTSHRVGTPTIIPKFGSIRLLLKIVRLIYRLLLIRSVARSRRSILGSLSGRR